MGKYEEEIKEAEEEIKMADHLIYVTSPVVKDKNLLTTAFDHIYKSFKSAINGYLLYKRHRKEIFSIPSNTKVKVKFFLEEFGKEFGIEKEDWKDYLDLERMGRRKEEGKHILMKENSLHFILEEYSTISIKVEDIRDNLLMIKNLLNKIKENAK